MDWLVTGSKIQGRKPFRNIDFLDSWALRIGVGTDGSGQACGHLVLLANRPSAARDMESNAVSPRPPRKSIRIARQKYFASFMMASTHYFRK
jgi:hypothetical protein